MTELYSVILHNIGKSIGNVPVNRVAHMQLLETQRELVG